MWALVIILAVTALVCFLFQRWLRAHLDVVETSVSIVGGIASLVIAYYAYHIDQKVADNAVRQERTNRSIALSESIINDDLVRRLIHDAIQIEQVYDDATTQAASSADFEQAKIDAVLSRVYGLEGNTVGDDFWTRLVVLLQHVSRAAQCTGYNNELTPEAIQRAAEGIDPSTVSGRLRAFAKQLIPPPFRTDTRSETTCDSETFLALTGAMLADTYFTVRAVLACDPFFENQHMAGYSNLVYHYEYTKHAENNEEKTESQSKMAVLVGRSELEKALAAGDLKRSDHFMVIEFDEKHCEYYMKKKADLEKETPAAEDIAGNR